MIQKTYKISDFTDDTFNNVLSEVKSLPAYRDAAQVLLIICEQNWDTDIIKEKVRDINEALPKAQIAGINHWENWTELEYTHNLSILSFLFFEKHAFSIHHYNLPKASEQTTGQKLRDDIIKKQHAQGVMLFMAQYQYNVDKMLEAAERDISHIPFFGAPGAVYSDEHTVIGKGYIFDNDGCYVDEMIAVIFHGENLHIRASYVYGWTPVGKRMTVTKMDGDFKVLEIDNAPAAKVYSTYLGISEENFSIGNICEFPLILEKNGVALARIPNSCSDDGSLTFSANLSEGDTIRFSYGAFDQIESDIYDDSRWFSAFKPQAMMLIICMNRLIFLKEFETLEMDYYREHMPELTYLHGNSEIYRQDAKGGDLNSALIAVAIREGDLSCDTGKDALFNDLHDRYERLERNQSLFAKWRRENGIISDDNIIPIEYRVMNFLKAQTNDLEDLAKQAQAANEAKSGFLSSMSHEIRTPINTVLGMNEMILRESDDQQILDYASDIQGAGRTLLSLINDILDVSKIESGKMEIVNARYDLSSMIHDLAQMTIIRAKSKDLIINVKVDNDLPSEFYGDDARIKQILTNILTNAVKYTPQGTIWFRVSGKRHGDSETLHFEIEDTGIGIKDEDMPKLFAAFERIEEKRNRSIEGTGLGMNITRQLLHMMDSELMVESIYGKGSKFYFDLVQKIENDTPIGDFEKRIKTLLKDHHYERSFIAPDAHILVVDDNEMNLRVFCSLLKQTRVNITTATSGKECLKLAENNHYDIIFLDHMMPDMDGIETLGHLRDMDNIKSSDTPIYALTANAVSGAKKMYLKAGFDGFISKPIDAMKLENTIRKVLPDEKVRIGNDAPDHVSDDLPIVEGTDFSYALGRLGSRDILVDMLRDFRDLIDNQADKLDGFYDVIKSALDQKNAGDNTDLCADYRVQVHGMKSAAATVGITMLSGMANRLEYAARDAEYNVIDGMHSIFISCWRSYKEKLSDLFYDKDEEINTYKQPALAHKEIVVASLEMLRYSMDEMDVDKADELIDTLTDYTYPNQIADKIEKLKVAVTALDADETAILTDQICTYITSCK